MQLNADSAPPTPVVASRVLQHRRESIAQRVTALYVDAHPEWELRYQNARQKCMEDTRYHVDYLSDALLFGKPELFTEYAAWASALLAGLKIPGEALAAHFALLRTTLAQELDPPGFAVASEYLEAALARIASSAAGPPGYLEGAGALDILARAYLAALMRGERHVASKLVLSAAEGNTSIKDLYLHVFQRTLREIGRLWQINRISVAQEHYCTAATQLIMSQLYPYIFTGAKGGGTFVGTCVAGDLHEIGGRMIADFLEMAGWNSFYLGANTPSASIVRTLVERQADVLGVSATITHHVEAVAQLIRDVRAEPACARVKILVGGYPFNLAPDLWREIGADGWALDAGSVIVQAAALSGKGVA